MIKRIFIIFISIMLNAQPLYALDVKPVEDILINEIAAETVGLDMEEDTNKDGEDNENIHVDDETVECGTEIEDIEIKECRDLRISCDTKIFIELNKNKMRIGDKITGTEGFRVSVYNNDELVILIEDNSILVDSEFIPINTYITIDGSRGSEFNIEITLVDVDNIEEMDYLENYEGVYKASDCDEIGDITYEDTTENEFEEDGIDADIDEDSQNTGDMERESKEYIDIDDDSADIESGIDNEDESENKELEGEGEDIIGIEDSDDKEGAGAEIDEDTQGNEGSESEDENSITIDEDIIGIEDSDDKEGAGAEIDEDTQGNEGSESEDENSITIDEDTTPNTEENNLIRDDQCENTSEVHQYDDSINIVEQTVNDVLNISKRLINF